MKEKATGLPLLILDGSSTLPVSSVFTMIQKRNSCKPLQGNWSFTPKTGRILSQRQGEAAPHSSLSPFWREPPGEPFPSKIKEISFVDGLQPPEVGVHAQNDECNMAARDPHVQSPRSGRLLTMNRSGFILPTPGKEVSQKGDVVTVFNERGEFWRRLWSRNAYAGRRLYGSWRQVRPIVPGNWTGARYKYHHAA